MEIVGGVPGLMVWNRWEFQSSVSGLMVFSECFDLWRFWIQWRPMEILVVGVSGSFATNGSSN